MEKTHTERGFSVIKFNDAYDYLCTLQESSSNEPHIWLGRNSANPKKLELGKGWIPVELPAGIECFNRMHLNQQQVKELIVHLQKFVDTGGL